MPRVRARSPAFLSFLILFSGIEFVRGVSLIRRLPTLSVWSLGGAVLRHTFLVRPVEFSPVGRELSTGLVFAISWGSFLARSRFYESIHRRGGRYECFFLRGRRRDDGNPGRRATALVSGAAMHRRGREQRLLEKFRTHTTVKHIQVINCRNMLRGAVCVCFTSTPIRRAAHRNPGCTGPVVRRYGGPINERGPEAPFGGGAV